MESLTAQSYGTFIEEREALTQTVPFSGGKFNKKKHDSEPGLWQLDLRPQFPTLFVPYKETQVPVPNSENVEKCTDCTGREVVCPMCNGDGEPGFYKENQMMKCSTCYGRGLNAHKGLKKQELISDLVYLKVKK